jgi:hypothetical protein
LKDKKAVKLNAEDLVEVTAGDEFVLPPSTEALFGSVGRRTMAQSRLAVSDVVLVQHRCSVQQRTRRRQ